MLLAPLPSVTNCHTFSNPSPIERDVPYGRPLPQDRAFRRISIDSIEELMIKLELEFNDTMEA